MGIKKIIWGSLISLLALLVGFLSQPLTAGSANEQIATSQRGLIIDCSRQFYNVQSLKTFIHQVSVNHGQFVQLHLTDDHRYGVESRLLKQTTKKAKKVGSTYYNRKTHLAFLSKKQLQSLIKYGRQQNVEVIPEIDTPGHAKALLKLLRQSGKSGQRLAKQVTGRDGELNYEKKITITSVKRLLGEYTSLQTKGAHFGIGGDEFGASPTNRQTKSVKYTNALNKFLNQHHLKSALWNDNVTKDSLKHLNHNIRINYWSYDGQISSQRLIDQRRQIRATLPEMNTAGFQTINCNFAYLYIITNPKMFKTDNVTFWQNDLKAHWNDAIWYNWNHSDAAKSQNNAGSALSIWGTPGKRYYSQKQVLAKTKPFIRTYFEIH